MYHWKVYKFAAAPFICMSWKPICSEQSFEIYRKQTLEFDILCLPTHQRADSLNLPSLNSTFKHEEGAVIVPVPKMGVRHYSAKKTAPLDKLVITKFIMYIKLIQQYSGFCTNTNSHMKIMFGHVLVWSNSWSQFLWHNVGKCMKSIRTLRCAWWKV